MSWKIASALEGAKSMGIKSSRSRMTPRMGFALATVIALPIGYAAVRSLRR